MNQSKENSEIERIRSEASAWLDRLRSATRHERTQFVAWVKRDPRHGWEFLELIALDVEIQRCDPTGQVDVDELLRRASSVIAPLNRSMEPSARPERVATLGQLEKAERERDGRIPLRYLGGVAACLVAILGGVLWMRNHAITEYDTRPGEYRLVQLDDGSRVHLNSATQLRVRFSDGERHVDLLKGEALFDVAHNPQRPFRVSSRDSIVQAIGTQFDVQLNSDSSSVTVTAGRVAVTTPPTLEYPAQWVEVAAGQAAEIGAPQTDPRVRVHSLTTRELTWRVAWTTGSLTFDDRFLHDAVALFNRRNATQIVIDDPAIADLRVGGKFYAGDPAGFVAALGSLDIRATVTGSTEAPVFHLSRAAKGAGVPARAQDLLIESAP